MKALPYILIVIAVLIAGGIYIDKTSKTNTDGTKTNSVSSLLGSSNEKNSATAELKNQGKAPEFIGIDKWLNSDPLTMQSLRGKVVLIDFWTYSCINCIRTLPYVTKWYDTYKDQGLVIVGVHTPEFAFEKVTKNVETAIKRYKINYPVAQDNDFATWNAYSNQYWPAHYLVDQQGNIVYTHFGEGKYEETENAIRSLLGLNPDTKQSAETQGGRVQTREIYFGLNRLEFMSNTERATNQPQQYVLPKIFPKNTFALEGQWKLDGEKAVLANASGKIKLKFNAGKVHLVAASNKPMKINILVDGVIVNTITVSQSELYTLFDSNDYREHEMEIQIPEAGFEAFAFTFG